MFNFLKWLVAKSVAITFWAYKKSLKAAQKRIDRNNKVVATLSNKIVELENDSEVMKEYVSQSKVPLN